MEDEGSDLEIICPYCEYEFLVGIEEIHNDIECPECKNLIELEWNEDEKCSGSCGSCKGHCDDDDDDNNEEEEDVL